MSIVNWLKGMVRRPGARRRPGGSAVASFRPQVEPLGDRIVPSAGLKVLAPLGPASSAAVLMADSTCPQNTDLRVDDVLNSGGGGNGGTVNGTLAGAKDPLHPLMSIPGSPDSFKVGTSVKARERCAPVTTSARILPCWTCGKISAIGPAMIST